jgi:hypothetical protein
MIHARLPARRNFAVVGLTHLQEQSGVRWPATTVDDRQHLMRGAPVYIAITESAAAIAYVMTVIHGVRQGGHR